MTAENKELEMSIYLDTLSNLMKDKYEWVSRELKRRNITKGEREELQSQQKEYKYSLYAIGFVILSNLFGHFEHEWTAGAIYIRMIKLRPFKQNYNENCEGEWEQHLIESIPEENIEEIKKTVMNLCLELDERRVEETKTKIFLGLYNKNIYPSIK